MARIVIRNIEETVVQALRQRAAASGISLEEQARRLLVSAVGLDREEAVRRFDEFRRRLGPV